MSNAVEFWVMRVVAMPNKQTGGLWRPGEQRDATVLETREMARLCEEGRLVAFGAGDGNMVLEPIHCYEGNDAQRLADERADREHRAHPLEAYLVVVNADLGATSL